MYVYMFMPLVRGVKLANKVVNNLAGKGASDEGSNGATAGASVGVQCVVGPCVKGLVIFVTPKDINNYHCAADIGARHQGNQQTRLDLLKVSLHT